MKRFLAVIEATATRFSAYVPDFPGCISTGVTREEVEQNIREAIILHVEGYWEECLTVPEPGSYSIYVQMPP